MVAERGGEDCTKDRNAAWFLSQQLSSPGAASEGTPIITNCVYLPYLKI